MKFVWLGLGLLAFWTFKPAEADFGVNAVSGVMIPLVALVGLSRAGSYGIQVGLDLYTNVETTEAMIDIRWIWEHNETFLHEYEVYRDGVFAFDETVGETELGFTDVDYYQDYLYHRYAFKIEDEGYVDNVAGAMELEPGTAYNYTVSFRGINSNGGIEADSDDTSTFELCTRPSEPVVSFTNTEVNTTVMDYSVNPANDADMVVSGWFIYINSTDGDFFETEITTADVTGNVTFMNMTAGVAYNSWTAHWMECDGEAYKDYGGRATGVGGTNLTAGVGGIQSGSIPSLFAMVIVGGKSASAALNINLALLALAVWLAC